ncbi:hypothetical protein C8J55DRAFT_485824 [Lentinula edodes]|uniref:Uncharacterized protein n=1 Tax=Lentinula lateritia TaxID=40482 RepID=A0A9W9AY80_9AGAR|nr:hypothetical protein C8J55DRAFT_485824 [Lentinula edodes]
MALSMVSKLDSPMHFTRLILPNLYLSLYKTLWLLQKKVNGGKERSADTFIAGLIGGFLVFGEQMVVNKQATALVRPMPPNPQYFAVLAAVLWGTVMWYSKREVKQYTRDVQLNDILGFRK